MATIKDLVALAVNEVGYLEKKTNSQLDDKTANAGSNNYTKYARDLDNLGDFYNGKKQGYAWCDVFCDWCMVKTFGRDEAQRLLNQPDRSLGAGVNYSAQYYKNMNRWYSKPEVGDQIFFKSASYSYAHTGIVVDVTDSYVYTVEGNTSGASGVVSNGGGVCQKRYALNYANIIGYGRPNWTSAEMVYPNSSDNNSGSATTDKTVTVSVRQISNGMIGNDVKALQLLLNGYGCNAGSADGEVGKNTIAAIKRYQSNNGLTADGIAGKDTWGKLLSK